MTEDRLRGQWDQLKGRVRREWGKLTDDDVDRIQGDRERLIGTIRERYGILKDEAEEKVHEFLKKI